jgi:hypothetical protein
MIAVESVLTKRGYYLDLFGRFGLIELILDETHDRFNAELPPPREN